MESPLTQQRRATIAPRVAGLLALLGVVSGCAELAPHQALAQLVLLTREGCLDTDAMQANLDAALQQIARPMTYGVLDLSALREPDARIGYGTPTVLLDGRDLFGLPAPGTLPPPATCRPYPGGVPSVDAIVAALHEGN
jgi:hypothetical protein